MSTGLHTPEERTTGPSLSQSSKPQRVLACVLCQQRKVKCDRKFPCANCVKFRAQCVPATLTPRRRRRRFPERELLGRLRSYEDLLRQNNIKFEPFHPDSAAEESPNTKGGYDSDDEHPATADADWSSPSTTVESERGHEAKYASPRIVSTYLNFLGAFGRPFIKGYLYDYIACDPSSTNY